MSGKRYPEEFKTEAVKQVVDRGYQTIQENMLKGGISGRSAKGKRIHTRAIHSIDTDIKLNRALWVMAETLLESLR